MNTRPRSGRHRSRWVTAARLGQTAWFFGNVYEGLVGMPELLADARAKREPRLVGPGSPVRYFAPAAPLVFVATTVTLVRSWQSGDDRRLITATAASMATATAFSVYLIQSVTRDLLTSDEPLSEHDRHRMVTSWHRTNAMRLVALGVASASLFRLTSRTAAISGNRRRQAGAN